MDILVHKQLPGCRVYYEISVNGEEWRQQLEDSSALLQKYEKFPGYEDGNAPVEVVLEKYYDNLLKDRAARRRMVDNLNVLIPHTGLQPVSIPKNEIIRVSPEELVYSCSFEYMPEIKDLQFKGVVVEKPVRKVTEKDVDTAVKRYLKEHPALYPVNRKARKNDTVQITFSGLINNNPVQDGKVQTTKLVMGKDEVFPGLDKELHGHAAGENLKITLLIPKDHKVHAIAGKVLSLDVAIDQVWEFCEPTLSDAYVKEYADGSLSTVEELRNFLRLKVQAESDEISESLLENRINKALAGLITCDVPQSMLDSTFHKRRDDLQHIANIRGTTVEAILKYNYHISLEDFNRQLREEADMTVRQFLASDYIARTGELTVTPEEIEAYYVRMAKESGKTVEDWKEHRENNEQAIEEILMDKAVQLFRDNVVVKEVEVHNLPRV